MCLLFIKRNHRPIKGARYPLPWTGKEDVQQATPSRARQRGVLCVRTLILCVYTHWPHPVLDRTDSMCMHTQAASCLASGTRSMCTHIHRPRPVWDICIHTHRPRPVLDLAKWILRVHTLTDPVTDATNTGCVYIHRICLIPCRPSLAWDRTQDSLLLQLAVCLVQLALQQAGLVLSLVYVRCCFS